LYILSRSGHLVVAIAIIAGSLVIAWMTRTQLVEVPLGWANPSRPYLTIVAGTLTILLCGIAVTRIREGFTPSNPTGKCVS